MSWRAFKPDPELRLPPLNFPCRWRYGPGNYCGVHVTPPQRLCPEHEVAQAKRLTELKERAAAETADEPTPIREAA